MYEVAAKKFKFSFMVYSEYLSVFIFWYVIGINPDYKFGFDVARLKLKIRHITGVLRCERIVRNPCLL